MSSKPRRSQPSIPSRFETIFNGEAEKAPKGFGRKGYRFAYSGNDAPGPGHYSAGGSLATRAGTFSAKGYGAGFASRSQRFPQGEDRSVALPGPGHYGIPPSDTRAHNVKGSAAFQPATGQPRGHPKSAGPGPGSYREQIQSGGSGASAAFLSTTQRFNLASLSRAATAPGPGAYGGEEPQSFDMLAATLPTAPFRSSTESKAKQNVAAAFPDEPVFG